MEPEASDPIGEERYKISEDPDSRRCGFAGCKRWIKKDGHCAPCSAIEIQNAIEIKEWNSTVRADREARTKEGTGAE